MKLTYEINDELLQDLINIYTGLYYPLNGFMTALDYHHVVDKMSLSDNSVWTIPITLDVDHNTFSKAVDADKIFLEYKAREVGFVEVSDCYKVDLKGGVLKIFKTGDMNHPGVKKESQRYEYRIGGEVKITDNAILKGVMTPDKTRKIFEERGWKTIVAFNTRNPIHSAHEHLQRVGLDLCDGLFINPLIGWKKAGDFSENAVMNSYKYMIGNYYPKERVYLEGLGMTMRYSGPREAIFHAIVRRNLGCTHFIIGRDHAGIGDYYGKYEAHELAQDIETKNHLGIKLLLLKEPYFCKKCSQVVTEKHCGHTEDNVVKISGTNIRKMLCEGKRPDKRIMRPDIADTIISLKEEIFIREIDEESNHNNKPNASF